MRLVLLGALLLLLGCRAAEPAPPPPRIVVSDLEGNALWVVDAATREATPLPMPQGPAGMAVGEGFVAVALLGRPYLEILDPAALSEVRRLPLGSGAWDVAPHGGELAASCPEAGQVVLLAARGDQPKRVVDVGGRPYSLAWRDRRLFVTNPGRGSLQWIEDGRLAGELRLGLSPRGLAIQDDRVLVALYDDDAVVVVDAEAPRVLKRHPLGGGPYDLLPTGGGALVSLSEEGALAALDLETGKATRIPLAAGAAGMARTPNGQFLYVCCEAAGEVLVVGLHDSQVLERIALPSGARPRDAVFLP